MFLLHIKIVLAIKTLIVQVKVLFRSKNFYDGFLAINLPGKDDTRVDLTCMHSYYGEPLVELFHVEAS